MTKKLYKVGDVIHPDYEQVSVGIDPVKVEASKNAKFVGEFCLKDRGNWVNDPAQIYWQETPPQPGFSNYFAIFIRPGLMEGERASVFITSGESIIGQEIEAINVNGEVIYSRFRHDYRSAKNGNIAIDGGRDYTRLVGELSCIDQRLVLKVIDDELVVAEVL